MKRNLNLLLVEDNPGDADWIRERLSEISDFDYQIDHVGTKRDAEVALKRSYVDAMLLDLNLPDSRGRETLEWACQVSDQTAVTVLTGTDDDYLRVVAYNKGAQDYVVKGGTHARALANIIVLGIERQRGRLQQKQLEKIVAANPDAVIVADRKGKVHFVNDAAVSLFERSREQFALQPLEFPVQEGELSDFEIKRSDGVRHAEIRMVPFQLYDQEVFLAAVRDVTESRKIEAHLRETQKIEALGTLAGGIAHDFNNLLAMIAGNVQLALAEEGVSPTLRDYLDQVSLAARRASDLVRQILTFSRREETELKIINPAAPVEEAAHFLRATLPDRIAVKVELAPNLPNIRADLTQVQQVVINLGTNGAQAMPKGNGELLIKVDALESGNAPSASRVALPSGMYLHVAVRDRGVGMDRATIDRIFEPFFTTKAKGEGTGLGLAVVHGIVSRHGGAITVESEPTKGTTFHVFLPAVDSEPEKKPAVSAAEGKGAGQRILFVDDENQLILLVRRMLERLNYRVTGFEDAQEALALFQADPDAYDVVISDLSMPGMDGPTFIRRVRALRPKIPVLLTTGFLRSEDADAIRDLGVSEIVVKPDAIAQLGEILQRVLQSPS